MSDKKSPMTIHGCRPYWLGELEGPNNTGLVINMIDRTWRLRNAMEVEGDASSEPSFQREVQTTGTVILGQLARPMTSVCYASKVK